MRDGGIFTGKVATSYDAVHGNSDTEGVKAAIATLSDLAGNGAILEFAIGTGRIALPLQEAGHVVKGIELSADMVAELRKKETGASMEVAIGDMTETRVPGTFSLVVLVYNTIDNLTTQAAQVACFKNAAAHLAPGGRFVVETLVPPIQRLPFGETHLAFACSETHWGIDAFDVVTQTYSSNHMRIEDGKTRRLSVPFRYAWPAELDLMAELAGLVPEHRWADWHRATFTATSRSHVSVWRKPG